MRVNFITWYWRHYRCQMNESYIKIITNLPWWIRKRFLRYFSHLSCWIWHKKQMMFSSFVITYRHLVQLHRRIAHAQINLARNPRHVVGREYDLLCFDRNVAGICLWHEARLIGQDMADYPDNDPGQAPYVLTHGRVSSDDCLCHQITANKRSQQNKRVEFNICNRFLVMLHWFPTFSQISSQQLQQESLPYSP